MSGECRDGTDHQSLGIVDEINIAIDEGDDGWVRINIVSESGDSTSALIPKEIAHDTALELSPKIVEEQYIETDTDRSGGEP